MQAGDATAHVCEDRGQGTTVISPKDKSFFLFQKINFFGRSVDEFVKVSTFVCSSQCEKWHKILNCLRCLFEDNLVVKRYKYVNCAILLMQIRPFLIS